MSAAPGTGQSNPYKENHSSFTGAPLFKDDMRSSCEPEAGNITFGGSHGDLR